MEERRKYEREQVEETAYICGSGSSIRCLVRNISRQGAALDVPDPAFIPACFKLMLKSDRIVRDCRIAWIMGNRIGVAFEDEASRESSSLR